MDISVGPLINSLETTTNSYKFYWLNGILSCLERPDADSLIPISDIVIEMLLEAWHPICQFKLYYGFYDRLPILIRQIQGDLHIPDLIKRHELKSILLKNTSAISIENAKIELLRYVPYRFLSTWCKENLVQLHDHQRHKKIAEIAFTDENLPYYFVDNCIQVRKNWVEFINLYGTLIRGNIINRLNLYLTKRNPNVPSIISKIQGAEKRNLLKAKTIWAKFLVEHSFSCIYSAQAISESDFSLDHFIPWSYVVHDEIWNIIPTTKSINSQKSDKLPAEIYLDTFIHLQFQLFHFINESEENWEKYLVEYTNIFKMDLKSILKLDYEQFSISFKNLIYPMLQIARNMGFISGWALDSSFPAIV
ncbi:HNH endonuclease domain-containing protein [Mucilaginibacter sp.]